MAGYFSEVDPLLQSEIEGVYTTSESEEVFGTIAGIFENEELRDMITVLSRETTTLAQGYAVTPHLEGLPPKIISRWHQHETMAQDITEPEFENDDSYLERVRTVAAYGLHYDVGLLATHSVNTPFMVMHLSDSSGERPLTIRKVSHPGEPSLFKMYDAGEQHLGNLEATQVAQLLASLAGLRPQADSLNGKTETLVQLIQYLGESNGVSSNEFKLTARLGDDPDVPQAETYGAVLYRDEVSHGVAKRSVVIERLMKFSAYATDKLVRFETSDTTPPSPVEEKSISSIRLDSTTTSDANYDIEKAKIGVPIVGNRQPQELSLANLGGVVETLQEVICASF
ncbi:MAG: hypothetical protein ABI602_04115 [Candidatus Saccharibacteria bacterium]